MFFMYCMYSRVAQVHAWALDQFTDKYGKSKNHAALLYILYRGDYKSVRKILKFSVLVGTAIKSTETSSWDETRTECMHFNPCFSCTIYPAKVGIKMRVKSVCVSSQLLVSVLFIAVPTNTENLKIFLTLVCSLFLVSMQSYSYAHTIVNMLFLFARAG